MKKFLLLISIIAFSISGRAQTVAQDFTQTDCEGFSHHLYSELDSGYVVILEFIMTCNSCVVSGQALETMIAQLDADYPGKVRFYQFAYTNSYTCATMLSWKTTNGFQGRTFDQGAAMVAYYGGFGMPTVAIVGGTNHGVIYTGVGFTPSDTLQAGNSVRNFFATVGLKNQLAEIDYINTFPNPASENLTVELRMNTAAHVTLQIVDINGRLVSEIYNDAVPTGKFTHNTDVSGIASGVYLLKTIVNENSSFSKIRISN